MKSSKKTNRAQLLTYLIVTAVLLSVAFEFAPPVVFTLKGLPEQWSDMEHRQYLEGLEAQMQRATNFEEKWHVIQCLLNAEVAFTEPLNRHWFIEDNKAAFQQSLHPGTIVDPPYRADDVYQQYAQRLHHCCVLAGGERIARLFNALVHHERNPEFRARALILTVEVSDSLNIVQNDYMAESFFKDFARVIVSHQPDFVQRLEILYKQHRASGTKYTLFYHNVLEGFKQRLEP